MYIFLFFFSLSSFASIHKFEDFYQSMMKKNNVYWGAIYDQQAAFERNEGTLGLYMPNLSAALTQSRSEASGVESLNNSQTVSISGKIPQLGLGYNSNIFSLYERIKPSPKSYTGDFNFGLSLNLLKDFGPRVGWINFRQAELNLDISKLSKLKTIYFLTSQLLSSYSGAFASQKNLKINSDSEITNKESLRKAQAQFDVGKIPKLSLLTVQAQSQQLRSQVIGVERFLRESFKNLYTLSSVNQGEAMVDLSINLQPIQMPFFNEKIIDNLITRKLDFQNLKNPDFQIGKLVLQQAEFPVIQARNNLYPTLDLAYTITGNQVGNTRPGYFPGANSGNIVALNFSMPIGFVTERHEMAATNLTYLKAQRDFSQLKIQLSRDWENIVANYKLLREQIQIARLLVQAAREKYDAALPTATLGTTYQQNVISFQNELVGFGTSLNLLEVEFITAQLQVLTFHADPHVYEVFAPYGLK